MAHIFFERLERRRSTQSLVVHNNINNEFEPVRRAMYGIDRPTYSSPWAGTFLGEYGPDIPLPRESYGSSTHSEVSNVIWEGLRNWFATTIWPLNSTRTGGWAQSNQFPYTTDPLFYLNPWAHTNLTSPVTNPLFSPIQNTSWGQPYNLMMFEQQMGLSILPYQNTTLNMTSFSLGNSWNHPSYDPSPPPWNPAYPPGTRYGLIKRSNLKG